MRPSASSDQPRQDYVRLVLVVGALVVAAALGAWYLQGAIPRHIVIASGVKDGLYREYAQRYKVILERNGVTVEERTTGGAEDNINLLLDPNSGVDVAFTQGGVAPEKDRTKLVMLASLYYEPLWIFYRGDHVLTQIDELRYKRIAVGTEGHGVSAFAQPLLAANGLTGFNTRFVPIGNIEALRELQSGKIDAALFIGAAPTPAVWQALHDPALKLMSLTRADAYPRRFHYISRLTLPAGAIDLALRIPAENVALIGTKAMLVARDDIPSALVNLLLEAARELHGEQGLFESAREFPSTAPVDFPVSETADRHNRFGPTFLQRYLPFWVATFLERLIILVIPLIVVIVPLVNFLPQLLRWRVRSRIYRWYGELALLERDVESRQGELPIERWLRDLDRIEHAAAHLKTPARFASESYTLREHILLVRRSVLARAGAIVAPPQ